MRFLTRRTRIAADDLPSAAGQIDKLERGLCSWLAPLALQNWSKDPLGVAFNFFSI
jgi:hypothetical protein